MVQKTHQVLKAKKGTGVLHSHFKNKKGAVIQSRTFLLFYKKVLSFRNSTDEGWYNANGQVSLFKFSKNRLFMRRSVVVFNFLG